MKFGKLLTHCKVSFKQGPPSTLSVNGITILFHIKSLFCMELVANEFWLPFIETNEFLPESSLIEGRVVLTTRKPDVIDR